MKAVYRMFPKEVLQSLLWGDVDGYEVISDEMYDTSRWSIHYTLVFKFEDKFYEVDYSRGATECQDESPFEYEGAEIKCTEVKPVEVTVIKYETVMVSDEG